MKGDNNGTNNDSFSNWLGRGYDSWITDDDTTNGGICGDGDKDESNVCKDSRVNWMKIIFNVVVFFWMFIIAMFILTLPIWVILWLIIH